IAVSLEFDEHANFARAAELARQIIEQILAAKSPEPQLYNLNIPTAAVTRPVEVHIAPMGVARYGEHYIKRVDPRGRAYFWATNEPRPPRGETETDLTVIEDGNISLTPLDFDMTKRRVLEEMKAWKFSVAQTN
ncbi:MAG: hypothetical protein KDA41_00490, partial [Planctomycetales bacterium]|nr:hypothetical protein [Planctomycetales bacterium]